MRDSIPDPKKWLPNPGKHFLRVKNDFLIRESIS